MPERTAGRVAGERLAAAPNNAESALCLLTVPFEQALVERCEGLTEGLGAVTTVDFLPIILGCEAGCTMDDEAASRPVSVAKPRTSST